MMLTLITFSLIPAIVIALFELSTYSYSIFIAACTFLKSLYYAWFSGIPFNNSEKSQKLFFILKQPKMITWNAIKIIILFNLTTFSSPIIK